MINNEFEYQPKNFTGQYDFRFVNTAQAIMNFMVFENSPTWYWLHALKPLGNEESLGYSLGMWRKSGDTASYTFGSDEQTEYWNSVEEQTWAYNYPNYNALRGFLEFMPWDSVRYGVSEDEVRKDQRIMAWKTPEGQLVFAVTNRDGAESFAFDVDTGLKNVNFNGYALTAYAEEMEELGTKTGGSIKTTLEPYSIQFWVQEVDETMTPASAVELSETTLNLIPEGTAALTATVKPENAANKNVRWTSSDSTIATVDENGNVTALKEGTVTITATAISGSGKYSADCIVTIQEEADESVAQAIALIDAIGEVTLEKGEAIEVARNAYDALPEAAKQEVTNYQTLLDAETEYAVLVSEKNAQDAAAAKAAAEEAKAAAEKALEDALAAQAKAEDAKSAAEKAKADAEAARDAALKAEENAGKDASAAADAKAAADAAQAKAETAQRAAETAQAEAEAAQDKAEIAQTAAEAAAKAAEENNAAAAAEAAKAAKDAAKSAEEALKAAASATESAASAAESASFAAKAAESAKDAQIAQKAAEEAQAKAEQAQKAAEEAQKAAEKAALDGAKYQAALNLDTYADLVDQSEYDAMQVEALAKTVSDAKAAIAEAESTAEIDMILRGAKQTISTMEDVCPSKVYTDVEKSAWYHDYVDFMVENGYMNGVSDTLFDVNGSVIRAQLVTILYRTAGEPSVEGLENPFTDVADGKWYTDAILWAAEEGIVNGVSENAFAPDVAITREQIVTILYRYDGEEEVDEAALAGYTDAASVSDYAVDAMNWAIANEIVNGVTETTLAPADTATRAQICAIVMRYLEN